MKTGKKFGLEKNNDFGYRLGKSNIDDAGSEGWIRAKILFQLPTFSKPFTYKKLLAVT